MPLQQEARVWLAGEGAWPLLHWAKLGEEVQAEGAKTSLNPMADSRRFPSTPPLPCRKTFPPLVWGGVVGKKRGWGWPESPLLTPRGNDHPPGCHYGPVHDSSHH